MGAPSLIPNLMAGNSTGVQQSMNNIGTIPFGNAGGNQIAHGVNLPTGPISVGGGVNKFPNPGAVNSRDSVVHAMDGNKPSTDPNNPTGVVNGSAVIPGTQVSVQEGGNTPFQATSEKDQKKLNDQLRKEYGDGLGNFIYSIIGNIGSNNDAYMQAYEKKMAGPNAEKLASLNTTLGNSGIGMDSSTAAIANADFQSNIVADEGFQEQQLQMNDLNELLGITGGLKETANKDTSQGGLMNSLGNLTGEVLGTAAKAFLI